MLIRAIASCLRQELAEIVIDLPGARTALFCDGRDPDTRQGEHQRQRAAVVHVPAHICIETISHCSVCNAKECSQADEFLRPLSAALIPGAYDGSFKQVVIGVANFVSYALQRLLAKAMLPEL